MSVTKTGVNLAYIYNADQKPRKVSNVTGTTDYINGIANVETIHFSAVFNYNGKKWIEAASFMSFITKFNNDQLEFTDHEYYFTPVYYMDQRYDQIQVISISLQQFRL